MKRIIFLDFDGVLHPLGGIVHAGKRLNGRLLKEDERHSFFAYEPLLADLLNQHPDVSIVAHTSWRQSMGLEALREQLQTLGPRLVGVVSPWMSKYPAILAWLLDNRDVSHYLVLDDAKNEFPWGPEFDRFGQECVSDLGPAVPEVFICDDETGLAGDEALAHIKNWLEMTSKRIPEAA